MKKEGTKMTQESLKATVYGKKMCPNCDQAKRLLTINNIGIDYKSIDENTVFDEFIANTTKALGRPAQSIPQIWINDNYVGGFNELNGYIKNLKTVVQ